MDTKPLPQETVVVAREQCTRMCIQGTGKHDIGSLIHSPSLPIELYTLSTRASLEEFEEKDSLWPVEENAIKSDDWRFTLQAWTIRHDPPHSKAGEEAHQDSIQFDQG